MNYHHLVTTLNILKDVAGYLVSVLDISTGTGQSSILGVRVVVKETNVNGDI